jgi:hypothetical protein
VSQFESWAISARDLTLVEKVAVKVKQVLALTNLPKHALPAEGTHCFHHAVGIVARSRQKDYWTLVQSAGTRFIGFMVSNSVLAFTRDPLEAYFHALASEGLSKATLHRKQACLRMFARFGLTHGLWTADPTAALASIPKRKRVPRPFSDDETHAGGSGRAWPAARRIGSGTPLPPGYCGPPRTSGSCRRRLPTRTISDTALYTLVTNEEEAGAIGELDFGGLG